MKKISRLVCIGSIVITLIVKYFCKCNKTSVGFRLYKFILTLCLMYV